MKKIHRYACSVFWFLLLLLNFGIMAEAGEFNLTSYQVGDIIGEYLIVRETSSAEPEKYVTEYGDSRLGKLEFSPLTLTESFEISMDVNWSNWFSPNIILVSGDSELRVIFGHEGYGGSQYIQVGDTRVLRSSTEWVQDAINNLKLSVSGTVAELYINGTLSHKIILAEQNQTYTKLIINRLKNDDRLFNVTAPGHSLPLAVKKSAFAFDLSLDSYQFGQDIGEYLIVKETNDGQKYITAKDTDRLKKLTLSPNFSSDFEIIINADWSWWFSQDISLASSDSEIKIIFNHLGYGGSQFIQLNDLTVPRDYTNWKDGFVNNLRLSVIGNIARFYVNDVLSHKVVLDEANLTYTGLVINGIKTDDRLFEIKGDSVGSPVQEVIWDVDGDKRWSLPDIIYGLRALTGQK